jgi:hypothetical protein
MKLFSPHAQLLSHQPLGMFEPEYFSKTLCGISEDKKDVFIADAGGAKEETPTRAVSPLWKTNVDIIAAELDFLLVHRTTVSSAPKNLEHHLSSFPDIGVHSFPVSNEQGYVVAMPATQRQPIIAKLKSLPQFDVVTSEDLDVLPTDVSTNPSEDEIKNAIVALSQGPWSSRFVAMRRFAVWAQLQPHPQALTEPLANAALHNLWTLFYSLTHSRTAAEARKGMTLAEAYRDYFSSPLNQVPVSGPTRDELAAYFDKVELPFVTKLKDLIREMGQLFLNLNTTKADFSFVHFRKMESDVLTKFMTPEVTERILKVFFEKLAKNLDQTADFAKTHDILGGSLPIKFHFPYVEVRFNGNSLPSDLSMSWEMLTSPMAAFIATSEKASQDFAQLVLESEKLLPEMLSACRDRLAEKERQRVEKFLKDFSLKADERQTMIDNYVRAALAEFDTKNDFVQFQQISSFLFTFSNLRFVVSKDQDVQAETNIALILQTLLERTQDPGVYAATLDSILHFESNASHADGIPQIKTLADRARTVIAATKADFDARNATLPENEQAKRFAKDLIRFRDVK